MRLRFVELVLALVCLCACTGDPPAIVARPSQEATDTSITPSPSPTPRLREPRRRVVTQLPTRPVALAHRLVQLRRDLFADIDRWVASGADPATGLGRRVSLESVTLQRLLRKLVADTSLARAVLQRLPTWLRTDVARHIELNARLRALLQPVRPPVELETVRPLSPRTLLDVYKRAARRYDVGWQVLAAVNFVETRFGRILGPSSAGALGPMQFLPSTWERYGRGGNIRDPRDAVPAAARLLRAAGAARDVHGALLAYNNSDAYADAVMTYAQDMRNDPRAYYFYWCWEVFVITTKGDVQLTGPGAGAG